MSLTKEQWLQMWADVKKVQRLTKRVNFAYDIKAIKESLKRIEMLIQEAAGQLE